MVLIGLEARVPILNNNQNGSSDIGKKTVPLLFYQSFLLVHLVLKIHILVQDFILFPFWREERELLVNRKEERKLLARHGSEHKKDQAWCKEDAMRI
jgi:hypothetical protein